MGSAIVTRGFTEQLMKMSPMEYLNFVNIKWSI